MHLRLVVSNDSPKALPAATAGTPSERLSVAEKRAIRDAVMSLELLPSVTIEAALAEYTELGKFIDFAASAEGVSAEEIAKQFKRSPIGAVQSVLDALEDLGMVESEAGQYRIQN